MKILSIHADYLEYAATKKALKTAEEANKEPVHVDDCLVIFTAVERSEEPDPKQAAQRLKDEIKEIASQVKAKTIVLYPYAHLSSELAPPNTAIQVLQEAESLLKQDYTVYRAPFGWYKAFEIKAKGHPLSELSRQFSIDATAAKLDESEAVKKEETLKSTWCILEPDGTLHELHKEGDQVKGFDFKQHKDLGRFTAYEIAKSRVVKQEPPHVKSMRSLELVDYEEGSDPGNLRYYPKGRLIKSLLEQFVTQKTIAYGAMEIESPIMYDYEHPSLKSYLNRFPARQYTIQTPNKKVFLRFAACFGQFLMAKDATISYKQLPLKLYELTRYSFRVEQRGELAGLRRLRAFTMPDCHALCQDLDQAKQELLKRFQLAVDVTNKAGIDTQKTLELGVRITKDLWDKEKAFVVSLVKQWGKPVLLEMWNDKFFYFIFKYEFNYVDVNGKAAALATDQIDVENAERYGITYVDSKGKKQHPIILHLSPSGAIERVMWALLEQAAEEQRQGRPPLLPLWLSPTQVRIIPVSNEKHLQHAQDLLHKFEEQDIRADIDDHEDTIGKRIRNAEHEWVPFVLVIGDKEAAADQLTVRIRATNKQEAMGFQGLVSRIKNETKGMPFRPLPLPRLLSQRPTFVG